MASSSHSMTPSPVFMPAGGWYPYRVIWKLGVNDKGPGVTEGSSGTMTPRRSRTRS